MRSIPMAFVSTSSSHSSSDQVSWLPGRRTRLCTLFTTICTAPKWSVVVLAAAFTCSMLVMSVGTANACTPFARLISSAAWSSISLPRANSTTLTPSAASPLAMALPIPLLPPVMTAVRPLRPSSIAYSCLDFGELKPRLGHHVIAGLVGHFSDPVQIHPQQLPVAFQGLAGDKDRVHVAGIHSPDHRANRIVDGEDVGAIRAQHDNVCLFARRQGAGLVCQAVGARPFDGGEFQQVASRQGRGHVALALHLLVEKQSVLQGDDRAHLREHVVRHVGLDVHTQARAQAAIQKTLGRDRKS